MLEGANLPFWVTVVLVVLDFTVQVVALGLVPSRRRPSSGMAWLLLIFFLPGVGILLFGLIGSTFVPRRRRNLQAQAGLIVHQNNFYPPVPRAALGPDWLFATTTLNAKLGWLDPVAGNRFALHAGYEESLAAMTAAVETAERFVHVEFYIVAWDDVTDPLLTALTKAAARGVKVRLLFDHLASLRVKGYRQMLARLDETQIEWHPMLPLQPLKRRWRRPDLRNHRKLLVVDGGLGFTGSQNLIHPSYHNPRHERRGRRWQDLMVRVDGPAAHSLNIVFAVDWYLETTERLSRDHFVPVPTAYADGAVAQVLGSGPGFPQENNLRMFNSLIYGAKSRVSITSPYFVPDESLLYAITTAAQRGVEVELFVSAEADQFMVDHAQKSYYTTLLEAGVRIWCYPAPTVLHAKHITIDDQASVIGSSNMDIRSFDLDFEVSLLVVGPQFAAGLRAVQDSYRAVSTELSLAEWRKRPLVKRYLDNVLRLTSALQ